ncbi:MAG: type II toxin-antitoxin system HicA family toxin [Planctomycetes bacterium]|jgi:predicted RNA binding protein YcfA (HicA-like mRNA interferase family)|nr:type II toxin-antitoxin system HicA family toxin [Planctomycetota bacterium]
MKRTKLVKHLHQNGCRLEREGGCHTIYTNANGTRKTAIPRHSEVKPNTVRKICTDLGIPLPTEK